MDKSIPIVPPTQLHVTNYAIIGADNGSLPLWYQTIVWTNTGLLLIETNFSEIWIKTKKISFTKIILKMSAAKRWPFCLRPNVLKVVTVYQGGKGTRDSQTCVPFTNMD